MGCVVSKLFLDFFLYFFIFIRPLNQCCALFQILPPRTTYIDQEDMRCALVAPQTLVLIRRFSLYDGLKDQPAVAIEHINVQTAYNVVPCLHL